MWNGAGGHCNGLPIESDVPFALFLKYLRGPIVEPIWEFAGGSCCYGYSEGGSAGQPGGERSEEGTCI